MKIKNQKAETVSFPLFFGKRYRAFINVPKRPCLETVLLIFRILRYAVCGLVADHSALRDRGFGRAAAIDARGIAKHLRRSCSDIPGNEPIDAQKQFFQRKEKNR